MTECIAALSFTRCIFEALRDSVVVGIEKLVVKCLWREIAGVEFIAVSHSIKPLAPLIISFLDPVVGDVIMRITLVVLSEIQGIEWAAYCGLLHDDSILSIKRVLIGKTVVGRLSRST